jgi:hypothetical protein
MTGILTALSAKLTERWLALLALPGVAFVAASVWAIAAGHTTPFSAPSVFQKNLQPAMAIALAAAAIAAGYVACGVGAAVRIVWFAPWRGPAAPVGSWLTARRRAKAENASGDLIPTYLPARPTIMADRFRLAEARVAAQYGSLDLPSIWPRLWLLLPEDTRTQVTLAASAVESASVLAGWAVLYCALGALCYPAILAGVVLLFIAWRQARVRSDVLAELLESTVDVHLSLLLKAFGEPECDHMTKEMAARVNDRVRKGA